MAVRVMTAMLHPIGGDPRPVVVALHCSGGTAGQWRALGERIQPDYRLLAPNLHGAPGGPVWNGDRRFHLADEAETVLSAIEASTVPVHLVGHSYGGAVALHIASRRPGRIASLTLYEPSAFYLLKQFGPEGAEAMREIRQVSSTMRRHFARGAWREAAAHFVDYWNGHGAWQAMRPELQLGMVRYLPKSMLDFHALIGEAGPLDLHMRFSFPVRLLRGEYAPLPTRLITEQLALRLPYADLVTIGGAGHMGPLTHPDVVAHAIAAHVRLADIGTRARAA